MTDHTDLSREELKPCPLCGGALDAARIAELVENGDGFWTSCTGCHEANEGYPTGPYSKALRCHLGNGCSECGGIGAVWDDTDYEDMARFMLEDEQNSESLNEAISYLRRHAFRPDGSVDEEVRAIIERLSTEARYTAEDLTTAALGAALRANTAPSSVLPDRQEVERLRAALERLGSMQAFTSARMVRDVRDDELVARINFARETLSTQSCAQDDWWPKDRIATEVVFTLLPNTGHNPTGEYRPHFSFPADMTPEDAIETAKRMARAIGRNLAQSDGCLLHANRAALQPAGAE